MCDELQNFWTTYVYKYFYSFNMNDKIITFKNLIHGTSTEFFRLGINEIEWYTVYIFFIQWKSDKSVSFVSSSDQITSITLRENDTYSLTNILFFLVEFGT